MKKYTNYLKIIKNNCTTIKKIYFYQNKKNNNSFKTILLFDIFFIFLN